MKQERGPVMLAGLRRGALAQDNLALVPASLLPYKATYQRLANQLPAWAVLVILPAEEGSEQRTLQTAAARLRAKGHPIATLSVAEVLAQVPRRRRPPVANVPPLPAAEAQAAMAIHEATTVPVVPGNVVEGETEVVPPLPAVPAFTRELRLVSIDASRNRARFYVLQWQPTLWGSVALVRIWGRLGGAGRAGVLFEASAPGPDVRLTRLVERRLRHGYQIVDWF